MTHRSFSRIPSRRHAAVALMASVCMFAGSPLVAASAASEENGAHKQVSANHGDCKHDNGGEHNGYDCPEAGIVGGLV